MLRYKPRQRVGTTVSSWKNAMIQNKNRGFMKMGKFVNVISDRDFFFNGIATLEGNSNGIRMSYNGWGSTAASVWWNQTFQYPLDITFETYVSGAADGLTFNVMNENGSVYALGGGGGNQGVPGGNVPPIAYVNMDQWNNGQPVPYTGFGDTRRGGGTQYPVNHVYDPINNGVWRQMRILWEEDGTVTVWRNGVQITQAHWDTNVGYPLPVAPVRVGCFASTGAATQDCFIRKVTVDDQILYIAPGL